MAEGAKAFLMNDFKPEKEAEKKYFTIPEGTELHQKLESSIDALKKDTIVTIVQDFEENDKYVKIKASLEDHIATVKTKDIIYTPDKGATNDTSKEYDGYTKEEGYHIIDFKKLNEAFKGVLKEGVSKVFHKKTPTDKSTRIVRSPHLLSDKEFWIEHKHLAKVKDHKIEKVLRKAPKSVLKATSFLDYVLNRDARFVMISNDEKVERYDTVTYMDGNNDIIELEDKIVAIVPKNLIKWKSGYYVAKTASFDAVNNCFANELLKDPGTSAKPAKLYPVRGHTYVKEDGTKDNRTNGNGNSIAKYRKVYYKLREHYKEIEYENRKVENGTREARDKEKTKLLSDVEKVYWVLPDNKKDLPPIKTIKDAIININNSKEITTSEGVYKSVVCEQILDSETGTYIQKGWVEASVIKKENYFSAYNWDKFGFNIIEDGGDEYMYVVQDYLGEENSESEFVNALWYQMDQNNSRVISSYEIDMAYKSKEFQDFVSKIVCKHKYEWSYTKEEIRKEVAGFYDYFINEEPAEYRGGMDELKTGELDAIDGQVEKLMFWNEASTKTYEPPIVDEPEVTNTNSSLDFRGEAAEDPTALSNNLETAETVETTEESDTTEEETVPRIFPNAENVYHFHPIAFINHMKLIFGEGGGGDCETLIWGNKVSCQFRAKVIKIAENLWGEEKKMEMANNLMAVFAWESGGTFKPDAPNLADSAATGLIQFMPKTAASLLGKKDKSELTIETTYNYWGKYKTLRRVKEFADMGDLEQLDYVEKYFKPLKEKDVEFVDFYLQVLYPASMGEPDDHIVFSKDGKGLLKTDKNYQGRINAYKKNDGFDTNPEYGNNDGKVTKAEIKKGVQKYLEEGQKHKNTCTGNTCTLNNDVKDGFDIEAAVSHLNKNAEVKPKYYCALYVRQAIDAGGLLGLRGHANSYYHDSNKLVSKGFTMIGTNTKTVTFKKGDIITFKEQAGHEYGHIQMYNGNQWVSDFKQNSVWVNKIYNTKQEYKIFRWE